MTRNTHDFIKKKVREEILYKPAYSLIPALICWPILMFMWALGIKMFVLFLISFGVTIASIGFYITWASFIYGDKTGLEKKILDEFNKTLDHKKRKEISALRKKLIRDDDLRTQELLDALVKLTDLIKEQHASNDSNITDNLNILSEIDDLYSSCVSYLEQTYILFIQSGEIKIASVKESILERREKLITEVKKSVDALGQILASFNELGRSSGREGQQKRNDLIEQLEIAKRVDAEINSWENPNYDLEED